MTIATDRILVPVSGIPSPAAGLFLSQLDDQNRRLIEGLAGVTPAELAWQPGPGTNTIGMLLAHLAIVEPFWISIAMQQPFDCKAVIGIGEDDDGMPIPADGTPPANLAGKDLAYYADMLALARTHHKQIAKPWTDAELDRTVERKRPDGSTMTCNVRWIEYHVLEHLAGHFGQILLLRHLYKNAKGQANA
jgi:uncharacterized damage-inducible protein DinB